MDVPCRSRVHDIRENPRFTEVPSLVGVHREEYRLVGTNVRLNSASQPWVLLFKHCSLPPPLTLKLISFHGTEIFPDRDRPSCLVASSPSFPRPSAESIRKRTPGSTCLTVGTSVEKKKRGNTVFLTISLGTTTLTPINNRLIFV